MDNSDLNIKLSTEIALGHQANEAWNLVKPFFEEKKLVIYEAFLDASIKDAEALILIKQQLSVLYGMEDYFKEKITTGQLAQRQLFNGESNGE